MPTVLRTNGFDFRIFLSDHRPAHVHVYRGGGVAIILIDGAQPVLREWSDMKQNDVSRALRLTAVHFDLLKAAWREIHGSDPD